MIMSAIAGNFFPPAYKTFPFEEGDLLLIVSPRRAHSLAVRRMGAIKYGVLPY
jgi:hypothetical protein